MDHLILLNITCTERGDQGTNVCKDFLEYLIWLISDFTIRTKPDTSGFNIAVGYLNEDHETITKNLYVKPYVSGRGSAENIDAYLNGLEYLGSQNILSHTSFNLIRVYPPKIEEVRARYLASAHISFKKVKKIMYEDLFNKLLLFSNKNNLTIDLPKLSKILARIGGNELREALLATIALALTAFLSGIHRYSLALRQTAFQTLLYLFTHIIKMASRNRVRDSGLMDEVIDSISSLLTVLIVDTYLWLPFTALKKSGIYGTELVYSIAALAIRENILEYISDKNSYNTICLMEKLAKNTKKKLYNVLKETYLEFLKHGREEYVLSRNLISNTKQGLLDLINRFFREGGGREVLVGALDRISRSLESLCKNIKYQPGSPVRIVLTVTEQFNPLIMGLIYDICKLEQRGIRPRLTIIYTPQTYLNYIITHEIIRRLLELDNIESYIMPSTEGLISKIIARNIVLKLRNSGEEIGLAILQGALMISLPLFLEFKQNLSKYMDRIIFI